MLALITGYGQGSDRDRRKPWLSSPSLRRPAIVLLSAAFAALCVLVALGAFTWLDQYAVDHWMPGLSADHGSGLSLIRASVPFTSWPSASEVVVDLWLYPASFPISGPIVAVCAWSLRRRGQTRAAALWLGAWVAGNAVEVLTKGLLVRPALFLEYVHVSQFDQSLPSGHTLRSILAAAAVASVWPRARPWAAAWGASVAVILVPAGWHTPTDVLGGLLLAGALVLGVREHAELDRVDHRSFGAGRRHEREPRPVEPQA